MKIVTIFLLLSVVLFFNGCESKKRVVVLKKELPSWYLHPPKSTNEVLYAVGEGRDQKEARLEALNMIISTLSISISSDYQARTVIKEGTNFNSKDAIYINEIKSHISSIRISSYEVLESAKLGFKRYAVLLKVNKERLFYSLKKELDLEFDSFENAKSVVSKENFLAELSFYRDVLAALNGIEERLLIMHSLNENFNTEIYLKKYLQLKNRYKYLRQRVTFEIISSSEIEDIKTVVESALIAKKYSVKRIKNAMHFTIYIKVNMKKSEAYGFLLLHTNLKIITKDIKGRIVGSNNLDIIGQSSTTYSVARYNVVRKFEQIVEQKGIAKVVGLDI